MHISLAAEKIIEVGPIAITNTMLATWVVIAILSILAVKISRNIKTIPGQLQNIFEFALEAIENLIQDVTIDKVKTRKFLPLVATFFIFIVAINWIGLVPGFETIGRWTTINGEKVLEPFLRTAASDLNTTLALAIISIVAVQIFGVKSLGLKYFQKFLNFKGPIEWFVGVIETVSEFAKIISFSFRLFGNVFAGMVLLAVISSFIPLIASVPFYGLELFVGFVQALVFAMLTTVFLFMATVSHDEPNEH